MARTRIKEMIERRKQVLRKTPKTLATKLRMEVNSLVSFFFRFEYIAPK